MTRFGFSSEARPKTPQLAFDFDAPPDWQRGPIEQHWIDPRWSCTCRLDGKRAGSFHRRDDEPWYAWVDLGWKFFSHTAMSSYTRCLGAFATPEEAEAALQKAAREARADPSLIWEPRCTKDAIRKSKANGWWRATVASPADA